ncbi:hypothetical protein JCM11641_007483 [Rhodosporidiobolus odoratus]
MPGAAYPIRFIRFDVESEKETEELKRQRVLCGWQVEDVELWRDQVRRGVRNLYWIFPSSLSTAPPLPEDEYLPYGSKEYGPRPADPAFRPTGHVALDWEDAKGEESLASKEKGVITLATFFILASQQGKGLGTAVMQEMETLAASPELGARAITLNTLDGNFASDPAWWARMGVTFSAELRNNERWYERYEYTAYRRAVPRYPAKTVDGEDILLESVFMRKELASVA